MIRALVTVAVMATALAVTGCMSVPAPAYQPSVDTTERLLALRPESMTVGEFTAAKGAENSSLNVRGSALKPGLDGKFSTFLRNALEAELRTAGLYDPASQVEITGTLTHNDLTAGTGKGRGIAEVSAQFRVTRAGSVVYEKTLDGRKSWDSSFVGAVAIPEAMNNYSSAVQQLIGKLFADPEFTAAIKR